MTDKNMADVADKAVDKLAAGVEQVAKAFERVAPHVWEVMVRQAWAEGIASLVTAGLLFALVAAFCIVAYRKRADVFSLDCDVWPIFGLVGGFAALITTASAVSELRSGILHVATPEYYAAQELLSVVK